MPRPPLTVTLTRYGPRKLDDDNLAASCKYVRDAIASAVGVDDGSPLYTWVYRQRVGRGVAYGVEVEITARDVSTCPRCEGTGRYHRLGFPVKECAVCEGKGEV